MGRLLVAVILVAAFLIPQSRSELSPASAATPPPNQIIDQATLVANQAAGTYTWKTSAPTSNNTAVNWTNLQNFINTKSCYMSTGTQLVAWADVVACSAAAGVTQHTTNTSGTAAGGTTGVSPVSPFTQTFTVGTINSTDTVALAVTYSCSASNGNSWSVTDGAGSTPTGGSGSMATSGTLTSSFTSGTTGTWTLTITPPSHSSPGSYTCTIGGHLTSWY